MLREPMQRLAVLKLRLGLACEAHNLLELENSRSAGGDAPAHNARENKGERGLDSSISYIYALLYYLLSRYLIIIYLINTAARMLNSGFRHSPAS